MPAFPTSIKVFQTFHDYTDIIWAISINECHDEIVALESILGVNPFLSTPYTTFGEAIQDLYINKAPANHTHIHSNLLDDNFGNDHPQYIMASGYPGFSAPVTGIAGSNAANLVTLAQVQSFGYVNEATVRSIAAGMIAGAEGGLMVGAWGTQPLIGVATTPSWTLQGGVYLGCTDASGRIAVNFNPPYSHCVQAASLTKMPPGPAPGGHYPCPPYDWIESQVTLIGASGTQLIAQFSHDYSWQPNMWVTFCWLAMGN